MTDWTTTADHIHGLTLGRPFVSHGASIHRLVGKCPPLDVNSTYAYLLLCEHFADTCVRAECDGRIVGFVSAYRPPARSEVIFVWQVAVAEEMRGKGLGKTMLRELLSREAVRRCRSLETTVSPSNAPSRALFCSLARELDAPVSEKTLFSEQDFEGEEHEPEILIHIGPLAGASMEPKWNQKETCS